MYYININNTPIGPISAQEVVAKLISKEITLSTQMSDDGADWMPISSSIHLTDLYKSSYMSKVNHATQSSTPLISQETREEAAALASSPLGEFTQWIAYTILFFTAVITITESIIIIQKGHPPIFWGIPVFLLIVGSALGCTLLAASHVLRFIKLKAGQLK